MNKDQLVRQITAMYGPRVAQEAVFPSNMGVMLRPHSTGTHQTANGHMVTFYIKVEGEIITEISFVASGGAVLFAAASLSTRLFQGMKMRFLLSSLDPDLFVEELPELAPEDHFSLLLVCEALGNAVRGALPYIREPWKKFYAKG